MNRAIARAPRRVARRRRDSPSHTSVHRSSECAGGDRCRCQLRCACGSFGHSVSFMLGAQRVPTDRFKRGVPAQGESPQRRVLNYSCTRPEPGRTDAATMFAANPEQNPSLNQKPRSIGLRSRRPSIFRKNIRSLGKKIGSRLQLRCRGAGICFGIPTYTGGHQIRVDAS